MDFIVVVVIITAGSLPSDADPPLWVILTAGLAIAAGTYLGGWPVVGIALAGAIYLASRRDAVGR